MEDEGEKMKTRGKVKDAAQISNASAALPVLNAVIQCVWGQTVQRSNDTFPSLRSTWTPTCVFARRGAVLVRALEERLNQARRALGSQMRKGRIFFLPSPHPLFFFLTIQSRSVAQICGEP